MSTRGGANDLIKAHDEHQGGRMMFLILVEEYGGKHDDGAVAMAAQDAIALNGTLDSESTRRDD